MYIKIMKPNGGFQLLQCSDYVELCNRADGVKEVVYHMKGDETLKLWRAEVTGDVYVVNENGKTVSKYTHNPLEVYNGERSKEELAWFSGLVKDKNV